MVRAVSMGQREGLDLAKGWGSLKAHASAISAAARKLEIPRLLSDRTVHAVLALTNLTLAVAFVTAMSDVIGPFTGAAVSLGATAIALMLMLRTGAPAAPAARAASSRPATPAYRNAGSPADGARREVSGLLAMMSHELRTPLNAILGNADAIRLEALGPIGAARYRESAAHIREGGQNLLRATEDMIALTGAVAAAAFAPHQPVDIEATALDVLRAAATDARQKGVELSWQPGTGRAVLSEATALRHAVTRIIDAALANAEPSAGIHVELLPCGNAVELLVTLTHADDKKPAAQLVDAGADRGPAALQVAVARTLLVLLGTHLHTAYGIDGRWRAIVELPTVTTH